MNSTSKNAVSCWFLSGATASGKTSLGIELARKIDAEIISLDSMAVYRELDIGTAKPSAGERAEIRHHLLDIVDPDHEFTIAEYLREAERAIGDIRARGKQVLFVGGTPLYLKAMLRGLFEGPSADPEFRTSLESEAAKNGPDFLYEKLRELDPESAARLHPNDHRRLIRALEVFEKTGEPIGRFQKQFEHGTPAENCRVFLLDWPRELLYRRINHRVDITMQNGFLEEAIRLKSRIPLPGKTAMQALGYRELFEHLDGKTTLEEAAEAIKQSTRQFAKRQGTWFRSLCECTRISMQEDYHTETILQEMIEHIPFD